jgi:YVTN family beta-propeller protein
MRTSLTALVALLLWPIPAVNAEPFVYVVGATNTRGLQVLTVIDAATNGKVAVIPLGESCLCVNPNGIAISRDGTRVFVSNFWSNSVSVVDTGSRSVIATIPTLSNPTSLAVSPDGSRLYVSAFTTAPSRYVVQVIALANGTTIAAIPLNVAQSGGGMAISPDGARVYVSNQALNANSMSVINTATNTVGATIPVGMVPRAIDVTPDGALVYVAAQESHAVTVVNAATNAAVAAIPVSTRPMSVRVMPNGARLYAVSENAVSVIDRATNTVAGAVSGVFLPRDVDFTPDGARAFIAGDAGVTVVDTASNAIVSAIPFNRGAEGSPLSIATAAGSPAPEPPTGLRASSIAGNVVTLQWQAPTSGPTPTSYLVEGGVNPGEVLGSLPTGSSTPSFTFAAPISSFYVRVRAVAGGSRSTPSNEIRVMVTTQPPCQSPPATPINFVAAQVGGVITVSWEPAPSGAQPTGYVLSVTGAFTGSFATTGRSLSGLAPAGTYSLSVAGRNECGVSAPTTSQTIVVP